MNKKIKNKNCLVEQLIEEAKQRGNENPLICVSCKCPKCTIKC